MGALTGQTIAASYEQLLHVDTNGGGNTTTLVPVKDGDNGTTFGLQLATTKVLIAGTSTQLFLGDEGGEYIVGDGTDMIFDSGADFIFDSAGTAGAGVIVNDTAFDADLGGVLHVKCDSNDIGIAIKEKGGGSPEAWGIGMNSDGDMLFYNSKHTTDASNGPVVMFGDDGGSIGIGQSGINNDSGTTDGKKFPSAHLHLKGIDEDDTQMYIDSHINSATSSFISLRKARGTGATPLIVQEDDSLGKINFTGFMGSNGDSVYWETAGQIGYEIDGTPSNVTTGGMPTRFYIGTQRGDTNNAIVRRLTILENGYTGIGDSTPSKWLEVAGDIHSTGNITDADNSMSDENLKTDIAVISGALAKVKALTGVTYKWNDKLNKKNHDHKVGKQDIGLIAQEVEALGEDFKCLIDSIYIKDVAPDWVDTETPSDEAALTCPKDAAILEYKGLKYGKLTALLVEAVKELATKVEALENA
jgi:hypothetical protein